MKHRNNTTKSQRRKALRESVLSAYLAKIGSRGGRAGSRESKVKAAHARWAKKKSN